MYVLVVFVTNLWMRMFPNYKEYFETSAWAQFFDEQAFAAYSEYWTRQSTLSRGYLLSEQLTEVQELQAIARAFDEDARNCMRPITVKMLKCKHDYKQTSSAYNISTKGV